MNLTLILIISGISLLFLILLIIAITKSIRKNRIKLALRFGRLEHICGRLVGLLILIDIFLYYFWWVYPSIPQYTIGYLGIPITYILLISLIATFVIWFVYLISHTLEKKLYPGNFR